MLLSLEVGESIQLGTCFTVFQSCYRSWAWCLIPEMFKKLPQIGARDVVTPGSVPYIYLYLQTLLRGAYLFLLRDADPLVDS